MIKNILIILLLAKEAELLEARNFCSIRGDYAERVYRILKPRCSNSPSDLTLKEVHDMLDSVASENLLSKSMILS